MTPVTDRQTDRQNAHANTGEGYLM